MPQMAPLMWLNLLIATLLTLLVLTIFSYFTKTSDLKAKELASTSLKSKKWLW